MSFLRNRPPWLMPALGTALLAVGVGMSMAPASVRSQPAPPPASRQPGRMLVISVDGLRPDVMLRAKAPTLGGLMETGAFTVYAQTTDVAITLPSHTSMLTGLTPDRHGVGWNNDRLKPAGFVLRVPTLFSLARKAGLTTAMVAGKTKFSIFGTGPADAPPPLSWSFVPGDQITDAEVAARAITILREHRPQVFFVHFPDTDSAGHTIGWGSPEQIAAVEGADARIGQLLVALDELGLRSSTTILVSADHGGAGKTHGGMDPRSRFIPWILNGPGVARNRDLTFFRDLTVHTEDTFATACRVLGLAVPAGIDGKPVKEAFAP